MISIDAAKDNKEEPVSRLSEREAAIVRIARTGATDKEIADEVGFSVASLRTHWNRIREKLGAVNRSHAIALSSGDGDAVVLQTDERTRIAAALAHGRVASWTWNGRGQFALMDDFGKGLFDIAAKETTISFERLLTQVWRPDRPRFERYLLQAGDLRPMTPIELRVGSPGDYRRLVRTVNLASGADGASTNLLLATTAMHTFDSAA